MGRQPVPKLQFKKNELIDKIPESGCQKMGGGVITQNKLLEKWEKKRFCY